MKINVENISRSYGKTLALNGFSAVFEPGIYALLGPNGSGKSTFMNILTGNLKADRGRILYTDGGGNVWDTAKKGTGFTEKIGFMPQYPGLYPSFTVEGFMWYMAAVKGVNKDSAREQIEEILTEVELLDAADKRISALSGGMKQRLALAQAVLGSPEILILDEPTAGLDPRQRIAIRNYISKIALNKIVIIATHLVSDVEYIAKEVILLKKGDIADNGPPSVLIDKMRGRVHRIICSEADIPSMRKKYRISGITRNGENGLIELRVLDGAGLPENAEALAPALEDYYLHLFNTENV